MTEGDHGLWTPSTKTWVMAIAAAVFLANWLWAGAEAQRLGGTALGGYIAEGHYFLNNHNVFTEVTRDVWTWSLLHTVVTLLSWPALVGVALFTAWRGRRRPPGRVTPTLEAAPERLDAVERSGRRGRDSVITVGVAGMPSSAQCRVEFYRDGIVLEVDTARRLALRRDDVIVVDERRDDSQPRIVVRHVALGLRSPVAFFVAPDSDDWMGVIRSLGAAPPWWPT